MGEELSRPEPDEQRERHVVRVMMPVEPNIGADWKLFKGNPFRRLAVISQTVHYEQPGESTAAEDILARLNRQK
jgi:hypothetical protein